MQLNLTFSQSSGNSITVKTSKNPVKFHFKFQFFLCSLSKLSSLDNLFTFALIMTKFFTLESFCKSLNFLFWHEVCLGQNFSLFVFLRITETVSFRSVWRSWSGKEFRINFPDCLIFLLEKWRFVYIFIHGWLIKPGAYRWRCGEAFLRLQRPL